MDEVRAIFTPEVMAGLGALLEAASPEFDGAAFVAAVFDEAWPERTLFERLRHMARILGVMLGMDYEKALAVVDRVISQCDSTQAMVFPAYIEENGQEWLAASANALARVTEYATCEFAIRPFIDRYPEAMHAILMTWTGSDNEHVRRLASEGTRYAIPWGSRLSVVKAQPDYALPILEALKDDPSEYVRKSVANNLNELAKIAPDRVVEVAARWQGGGKGTDWIIKHGCRTLIKQAYPPAMALFGLESPTGITVRLGEVSKSVRVGEALTFAFEIVNETGKAVNLRIGYDIGYMKANGKLNDKSSKISERACKPGVTAIARKHKMVETSSRRIYPGQHALKITLNSCVMAEVGFDVEG